MQRFRRIDELTSALFNSHLISINAIKVDGMRSIHEISIVSRIVPANLKFVANHVDRGKLGLLHSFRFKE